MEVFEDYVRKRVPWCYEHVKVDYENGYYNIVCKASKVAPHEYLEIVVRGQHGDYSWRVAVYGYEDSAELEVEVDAFASDEEVFAQIDLAINALKRLVGDLGLLLG